MPDYGYMIGQSKLEMQNVEALIGIPPRSDPVVPADRFASASGSLHPRGFLVARWHFDYMTRSMLDALLEAAGFTEPFTAELSKVVYMTTRHADGSYKTYRAIMVLPEELTPEFGGFSEVVFTFKIIHEVAW